MIFSTMSQTVKSLLSEITHHPFNEELAQGSLPEVKFLNYIQQDALYLQDFAKALAMIAGRLTGHDSQIFLKLALEGIQVEQDLHQHYLQDFSKCSSTEKNPACFMYTHYLLSVASLGSIEEAAASVLPCYWIYQQVGQYIAKTEQANNPYHAWISMYSSPGFDQTVQEVIEIVNTMAQYASESLQQKMVQTFIQSSQLEWHFWNDAYHMTPWIKTISD